eukprot:gene9637-11421_t
MAAVGVQNATVKVEALQLPFTLPTDAASTAAAVVLHADQNKMDGEFMSALRDCAFFTGDSFTVLESEMILIKTQTEELLQATDYAEGICGHDQPAAEETRNPSPHSALAEGGDDMIPAMGILPPDSALENPLVEAEAALMHDAYASQLPTTAAHRHTLWDTHAVTAMN